MKEIFMEILNDALGGNAVGYLATIIVGFIVGLTRRQPKFIQKLFNKGKDIIPDNVENTLVKLWEKVEPLAIKLYRTVLEQLAQEMLKEVNGEETNLSTGLRSTMRDVKIELEDKVRKEIIEKSKEFLEKEIEEKAVKLAEKVGIDLLSKAEEEILKAEPLPAVTQFTTNEQTVAIMDRLKGSAKNHVYNAYIELNKEDGKELEGKAGASITGLL